MKKDTYFASSFRNGWPEPKELEPYFLGPPERRWFFETRNDGAILTAEGAEGTEHFDPNARRRINIYLDMNGHPEHGVLLIYRKWGGGYKETYNSMGDLSRLTEHVRSMHGTPLPVGLFIPFERAWSAVKEFMETDGKLPKSIDWIEDSKLPPEAFPGP